MVAAGVSAAVVSICLTNGVIRAPLRSARTAISSVPIRAPIWRSEKPDFFACNSVVAGSVSAEYSCRMFDMSFIRLSLYRNHGSIAVSACSFSGVYPFSSARASA